MGYHYVDLACTLHEQFGLPDSDAAFEPSATLGQICERVVDYVSRQESSVGLRDEVWEIIISEVAAISRSPRGNLSSETRLIDVFSDL